MDEVKLAMEKEINRIELSMLTLSESLERNRKDYTYYLGNN